MTPNKKKVFILMTDGIGLRNFLFSQFLEQIPANWEVVFWHDVDFDFSDYPVQALRLPKAQLHPMTDLWKNVRKQVELNWSKSKANDAVYDTYRFAPQRKTWKQKLKLALTDYYIRRETKRQQPLVFEQKMRNYERKTAYYQACLAQLSEFQPDVVLSTNQRPVVGIAPITAAQDLQLPTATLIFSWDNLPKGTLVLDTDYYLVWSEHMRNELLHYYPQKTSNQVFITGSPQFERHGEAKGLQSREAFYATHGLDPQKKYLCYSGDDYTTSPDDPDFLHAVAKAVRKGNALGHNYGLIFRRCPVDFSDRYDEVLQEYKDVIVPIDPLWEANSELWSTIIPTKADAELLRNTIVHSCMVINLGSSMVFDFAIYNKPCAYIAFESATKRETWWTIKMIYDFVHFRSMPSKDAVIWLTDENLIWEALEPALRNPEKQVTQAQKWFEVIHQLPHQSSSQRIWETIQKIAK